MKNFTDGIKNQPYENKLLALERQLIVHIKKTWSKQSGRKPEETGKALLSFNRARYQIKIIKKFVSVKNKKLLEIGSGYATFLSVARKEFEIDAYGVEPAKWGLYNGAYEIGKKVLSLQGISSKYLIKANGEKLPFAQNSFDIVYSNYVLEHVKNEKDIFKEAVRVLKKGGILIFIFPNYNSFWEGHYGMIWLPYLNKKLAKIYVHLLRKNPSLIDELNFLTKKKIENILIDFPELKVVSWGEDLFEDAIKKLDFPDDGTLSSAKKILKFIKILGLSKVVFFLAKTFNLYTPIVLVGKKQLITKPVTR